MFGPAAGGAQDRLLHSSHRVSRASSVAPSLPELTELTGAEDA
jgi:hypothetical protein